ncbi:HET-domain-containing protein [Pseudoneurospora amorphoporcata]|uniref:HET-domain-containing protein n=1 Tax=Pseudoneurospora amorphoporcata TaxID=241081 RepID=A0AAN6NR29_9PEZI|nr:HET-domain-containing protein [Pseudoneurospora amorphoporcata]
MVLSLGRLDDESTCALCRFFCSVRRTNFDGETAGSYHLRRYSFDRHFDSERRCGDSALWAIDPDGLDDILYDDRALLPSGEDVLRPWFIPQSSSSDYFEQPQPWSNNPTAEGLPVKETFINYPLLRAWIKECGNHPTCNYQSFDPTKSHNRTTIRGIDCTTRRIVDLQPGDAYITLSYVWGKKALPNNKAPDNKADRALPDTVPKAIEDAMIVVQQLGQRYLWVDQYCIDQHDEQDKHAQIRNMDHIYEGSHATIVAFSGEDSSCGLPGVSSTPRIPQPRFTSPIVTLLSFAPSPARQSFDSSVWMRRGWTFQEALLSRRLLLFAHDQVYFFCSSGVWVESIMPRPRMLIETEPRSRVRSATITPLRKLRHPRYGCQIDISLRQLMVLIGSYSKRQLSFQADALNAFRGLLSRVSFITYWGVPCYELSTEKSMETHYSLAIQASDKTAASLFLRSLCWEPERTCLGRRERFPSWSWLGWKTSDGIFMYAGLLFAPVIAHSTLNIEDDDGTTISMFDLIRQLGPDIERSSVLPERTTYLWLEGPVFTLGFQPDNQPCSNFRFCPNHPLGYSDYITYPCQMKDSCTQLYGEFHISIRFRIDIRGSKELAEKVLKRKWDCLLVFTSAGGRDHFLILDSAEEHAGAYYIVVGTLHF